MTYGVFTMKFILKEPACKNFARPPDTGMDYHRTNRDGVMTSVNISMQ